MKRNKLIQAMNQIDDRYVEEAAPRVKSRRRLYKIGAMAACLAIMFTSVGLWLFIPFNRDLPDVSRYADSEYYDIIQKLSPIVHQNLYELDGSDVKNVISTILTGAVVSADDVKYAIADSSEQSSVTRGETDYQEITDNQVKNVLEGDLIKRTNTHIYYLNRNDGVLRIYSIAGADSKEVGSYDVYEANRGKGFHYTGTCEFYLSRDGRTVTMIVPHSDKDTGASVDVVALDVTDPANITEIRRAAVSGSYLSSRLTNGKLLLFTHFRVKNDPNFGDESCFVPQIDTGDGPQSIAAEDIVYPDVLTTPRYTVVSKFDENTLAHDGTAAFLSYSAENLYVSEDSVYATRSFTEAIETEEDNGTLRTWEAMTEIARLSYAGDGLTHLGKVTVPGTVKDRYCLDAYNGILRVVTTISKNAHRESVQGDVVSMERADNTLNASLYAIDINSMQIVNKVESFAPEGESVRSARFDGEVGYVCTSVQLSDPVFFFDLSDVHNITYKDTGTIEGFSSSLVNFGDGYLLGIGIGSTWDTLKIEVYEETEDGVASVCQYEKANTGYSTDYKSYYIDRENRLIGLGIFDYTSSSKGSPEFSRYVLLHFDEYALHELVNVPLEGQNEWKRAVYIDGYLYMFANGFRVEFVQ